MKYFRPKSLTWWAGAFLMAMGALQAAGLPSGWGNSPEGLTGFLAALTGAVVALTGGAGQEGNPAAMIGLGAGLIGLRDALARDSELQQWQSEDRQAELLEQINAPPEFEAPVLEVMPEGEGPLPPGVVDPFGPGGSRE